MDNNELLIQITKDHAVTGEKLDRIASDIQILNERITRRENEIEAVFCAECSNKRPSDEVRNHC